MITGCIYPDNIPIETEEIEEPDGIHFVLVQSVNHQYTTLLIHPRWAITN